MENNTLRPSKDANHGGRKDVNKDMLLYNAKLRLESRRQHNRGDAHKRQFPRARAFAYGGLAVFFLIALFAFLTWAVKYETQKYLTVFSATIQGVSTVFALIAAGTMLLMEHVATRSSKSLYFLPYAWVTGLFVVFVIIIGSDVLAMMSMPDDGSWAWLFNTLLVLNVTSVALSAVYVRTLLSALQPEKVFEVLQNRGKKTKSKEEAVKIVDALNDLAVSAIKDRNKSAVLNAIDTVEALSRVFCERWKGEDPGYDVRHPVRIVADCVGGIGCEAVSAGMAEIGEYCIDALCSMGFHHYDNEIHIDVWIFGNMEQITDALIEKKKGSGCVSTIIMEAKVASDMDKMSLAHWLICPFDEYARSAERHNDLEAARTTALGIEILAETFAVRPTSSYTAHILKKAIDLLKRYSEDEAFGSYKGYFGERGWSDERTIPEILGQAEVQMQLVMKKAFHPTSGDWPTPH